jgi:D-cysteine desulfhydrase
MEFPSTPIQEIKGNKNRIFIKRDDLLPFNFGGNKTRIAEEFLDNMLHRNCSCMVGYGNARSNLSRALAGICFSRGIKCYIISPDDDNGTCINTFNSKMVLKTATKIIRCPKSEVFECVSGTLDRLYQCGENPYYIFGNSHGIGNEAVPVAAYDKVFNEILVQENELKVKFDYIFLACGTGMTQAGLLAGKYKNQSDIKIVGISIARKTDKEKPVIRNILGAYSDASGFNIPELWYNDNVDVEDSYLDGGYGQYSEPIVHCIENTFYINGIPLDPTYTGKAFHGMLKYIDERNINNKNILFIHTGGTPLFFDFIR